mgnify:CR=1 FL=1
MKPPPKTAIVLPISFLEPKWAAVSIPFANPLTIQIFCLDISLEKYIAWLYPYSVQSLEPIIVIDFLFNNSILPSAYIFLGKSLIFNNFWGYNLSLYSIIFVFYYPI